MNTLHRTLAATVLALLAPFPLAMPATAVVDDPTTDAPTCVVGDPTCGPVDDRTCAPTDPTCGPADPTCGDPSGEDAAALRARLSVADRKIDQQSAALTAANAQVAKSDRLAERRATTIQRLRAKIRALR